MQPDAVMLIAFGGPERIEDVRPFLETVLRGRPVPPGRIEEVAGHYRTIGGFSPLNRLTEGQAQALRSELHGRGIEIPVSVGMRNWPPLVGDALRRHAREGARTVLVVVMAPFQTDATLDYYRSAVDEARREMGDEAPQIEYAPGLCGSDGFLEANAERVANALTGIPRAKREQSSLVFTAHSLPLSMPGISSYREQLERSACLVARAAGHPAHSVAYQSRSGSPRERWLEPDINDLIREEAGRGVSELVVSPIGFVCDNVEVLYDLDVEAVGTARELGVTLRRAGTAGVHPAFVDALARMVTGG